MKSNAGISPNVILTGVIVLVAAVVFGGVFLFGGNDDEGGGDAVSEEVLQPSDSHVVTDEPDADVTVVEFLDFQCPACASYYQNFTNDIEQEYSDEITFVVRNFPLDMHELAVPAARAAEAAGMQDEFTGMYHALFDNYESWAIAEGGGELSTDRARAQEQFDSYAEELGLDVDQFRSDMDSQEVADRVERDRADGEQAGVSGTPTLFINGEQFEPSGDQPGEELRTELDERLGS